MDIPDFMPSLPPQPRRRRMAQPEGLPSEGSVKKNVRKRDGQRCCMCGMTAEEHKQRFGKTLTVHRKNYSGCESIGPYEEETCETLCVPCHQTKHSLKCAVRQRDGFACRECGSKEDEYHPLGVHCNRGGHCSEWEWERLGVKEDECITLCWFCHFAKHSITPTVLRRDGFACRDCGKKPDDTRQWQTAVTVHRLAGRCGERTDASADPNGFVTLCLDCHEKHHPDRLAECIGFGEVLSLPKVVESYSDRLGITLPVVSKGQLEPYKRYLLLVNFFVEHFRKRGLPTGELGEDVLNLPDTGFDAVLRKVAAEEARAKMSHPLSLTRKEEKAYKKMTEEERQAFRKQREEERLDCIIRSHAEPIVIVRLDGKYRFVRI